MEVTSVQFLHKWIKIVDFEFRVRLYISRESEDTHSRGNSWLIYLKVSYADQELNIQTILIAASTYTIIKIH